MENIGIIVRICKKIYHFNHYLQSYNRNPYSKSGFNVLFSNRKLAFIIKAINMIYLHIFEIGTYFINNLMDWLIFILFKASLCYKSFKNLTELLRIKSSYVLSLSFPSIIILQE